MQELSEAVRAKIAAEVLEGLDEEAKAEILQAALEKVLGGYEIKNAIEAGVKERAVFEITQYLKLPDVQERVKREAVAAAEVFIDKLIPSLLTTLIASMMPYDGMRGRTETDFTRNLGRIIGLVEPKGR